MKLWEAIEDRRFKGVIYHVRSEQYVEEFMPLSKYYPPSHDRFRSRDTNELMLHKHTLEMLDRAIDTLPIAPALHSLYRSPGLNAKVGGTAWSCHLLGCAADLGWGEDLLPMELLIALRDAGFTNVGLYRTFIHVDTRIGPSRFWWGHGAEAFWRDNQDVRGRVDIGL